MRVWVQRRMVAFLSKASISHVSKPQRDLGVEGSDCSPESAVPGQEAQSLGISPNFTIG